eukprot:GHVN01062102.1.p1 GENE.GHVN01062102.1~~GHVN01062102.1.p1  ORF type:complete len:105 (-),score=26.59 GHVN01062102.1:568-882(-)
MAHHHFKDPKAAMSYLPPSWGGLWPRSEEASKDGSTKGDVWVEVVREGSLLTSLTLMPPDDGVKSHYILGSLTDSVDVVYENPTVSRRHAAIQFSTKGWQRVSL